MKTKYYNKDKLLILNITEEIDHHYAERIRNKADFEIQRYMPKEIVINFENVTFMDSAGIGMIIGRYKTAAMFRGNFKNDKCKTKHKKGF